MRHGKYRPWSVTTVSKQDWDTSQSLHCRLQAAAVTIASSTGRLLYVPWYKNTSVDTDWDIKTRHNSTLGTLSARLKHWSTPTTVCGRRHLYRSAYKNAPWWQEFLGCWPAAVEQFTGWGASARRRDRTVQTASAWRRYCLRETAAHSDFSVYRQAP